MKEVQTKQTLEMLGGCVSSISVTPPSNTQQRQHYHPPEEKALRGRNPDHLPYPKTKQTYTGISVQLQLIDKTMQHFTLGSRPCAKCKVFCIKKNIYIYTHTYIL